MSYTRYSYGTHDSGGAIDIAPTFVIDYLPPNTQGVQMTTATDEIVFTDEWDGFSAAVEYACYDAETKTFYIELSSGSTYSYANVPEHVWNSFKAALSKGRFYNKTIKGSYGPGTYLGYSALDDAEERPYKAPDMGPVTTVGTPQNFTYAPNATVTNVPRTFNLQAPLLEDTLKHTVRFTVDNNTEVKQHTLKAADVTEAVAEVNDIASALGLTFKVTEVVTHFA